MKKLLCLLLALFFVLSLAACGGDGKDTTPSDTKPVDTKPSNGRDEIEDSVPTDLNYADQSDNTVTFFVRSNGDILPYEICCEELMNDTLRDAIHYRNIDVENRLGVKIKQVAQDGAYGPHVAWFEVLSTAVNTNSSDYDAAAIYTTYGAPYALQNLYYNLNDVSVQNGDGYIDLEKPWWNQSIIEDCTMYDVLYFLCGDLSVSGTSGAHLIWFNKDLFNQKFPDEDFNALYDYVDKGTWTIARMTDYASQVWDDMNSSGTVDDGDVVGFRSVLSTGAYMDSWIYAMGINILDRDTYGDYSLANFGSRMVPAFERVKGLYESEGSLIGTGKIDEGLTNLGAGNVLFVDGSVNDGSAFRNSTVNYGCLPMPKYDAEQEEYGNAMWTYTSLMVLLNNLSDDRAKMVSAVLELLAAESYKQVTPAYYSKVITGQYSKDEADARMFDIVLNTCRYSFESVYSQRLGGIMQIFRSLDADVQNKIDTNKDVWPTKLTELLEGLEALS